MNKRQDDFKVFKAEAEKWIEYFGLKDWNCSIVHGRTESSDAAADCGMDGEARLSSITFDKQIEPRPKKNEIKYYAFHEVCHLLLSGLSKYARTLFRDTLITEEEHKIIQILTNTVFKDSL